MFVNTHFACSDRVKMPSCLPCRKLRFLEPTQELRTSYMYNNLMYGLISHVSETLGEDTWENLMTSRIFQVSLPLVSGVRTSTLFFRLKPLPGSHPGFECPTTLRFKPCLTSSGSRGPWGPGPPLPPRLLQNHAVFRQF